MPEDLISRLRTFNQERIPELVTRKYQAMRANPFAFFRGSCHLFFQSWPVTSALNVAPLTWLCGDLHLENFGTHKGENRLTYFDINDFDDGALAPCTWDVARFVTSLHLAGAQLNLAEEDIHSLSSHCLEKYFSTLASGQIRSLERATAAGLTRKLMRALKTRQRSEFLDQRTTRVKKERRFKLAEGRYEAVSAEVAERVTEAIHQLGKSLSAVRFYRVQDIAFRVAGTGSLGLRRYAILVEGRGSPDDNFILDLKESRASSLAPYLTHPQPQWASQAHRIVSIQARMQAMSPALLTPIEMQAGWYVLRELQPSQDKFSLAAWQVRPQQLKKLIGSMAEIIAWNQLRSGGRAGSAIADELMTFGERAELKDELLQFAHRQAQQTRADYGAFLEAFAAGELG